MSLFCSVSQSYNSDKNYNIKSFSLVDWDNDGKTDIFVLLEDNRFGYFRNISEDAAAKKFSEIVYIEHFMSENKIAELIPQKNETILLEQKTEKTISVQQDSSAYTFDRNKLAEFINSKETSIPPELIAVKTEKKLKLAEPDNKIVKKEFDLCLLNIVNASQTKDSFEMEWLKTGVPELLMYEFTFNDKIRVMPRTESKKLNPSNAFNKSSIVVTGEYSVSGQNLTISLDIITENYKDTLKISGTKDNDGVLMLISKIGKELNLRINKLFEKFIY
jgi:hypothetical protein